MATYDNLEITFKDLAYYDGKLKNYLLQHYIESDKVDEDLLSKFSIGEGGTLYFNGTPIGQAEEMTPLTPEQIEELFK